MANNRMYLCCSVCAQKPETSLEECIQYLAKYYPETGWYVPSMKSEIKNAGTPEERTVEVPSDWAQQLDRFLETHGHNTMYGQHIVIVYEDTVSPLAREKRDVLSVVGEAIRRSSQGDLQ